MKRFLLSLVLVTTPLLIAQGVTYTPSRQAPANSNLVMGTLTVDGGLVVVEDVYAKHFIADGGDYGFKCSTQGTKCYYVDPDGDVYVYNPVANSMTLVAPDSVNILAPTGLIGQGTQNHIAWFAGGVGAPIIIGPDFNAGDSHQRVRIRDRGDGGIDLQLQGGGGGGARLTLGSANAYVLIDGSATFGTVASGHHTVTGYVSATQAPYLRYGDSSGAPGNATLDAPIGRSAIAVGGTAATITNSEVAGSNTVVHIQRESNDATCNNPRVSAVAAGSFTVTCNAMSTAAMTFSWQVINAQ